MGGEKRAPWRSLTSLRRGLDAMFSQNIGDGALGPVANTDTKLLIYGLFQKGRVLAQDGVMTPKSGVMFLKNSPLCRGHVSENGVGNVSEKHALKWGHDPDKSHIGFRPKSGVTEPLGGPLNLDFCTNAPGGPSWTKHTSRLYPLPVLNPTLR